MILFCLTILCILIAISLFIIGCIIKKKNGMLLYEIYFMIAIIFLFPSLLGTLLLTNRCEYENTKRYREDIILHLDNIYNDDLTIQHNFNEYHRYIIRAENYNSKINNHVKYINNKWHGFYWDKDIAEHSDELIIDLSKYQITQANNKIKGD